MATNSELRPGETEAERDDRHLVELLQELRVAGLGVQVIFAFLLALPFTVRFSAIGAAQRALYVAALCLAAVSTALLLGPVAYHRLVFRRHLKRHLIRAASTMALAGLATVARAKPAGAETAREGGPRGGYGAGGASAGCPLG